MSLYQHRPHPTVHRARRASGGVLALVNGHLETVRTYWSLTPGWVIEWTGRDGTTHLHWWPTHRDAIHYATSSEVK